MTTLNVPEVQTVALQTEADKFLAAANAMEITTNDQYVFATKWRNDNKKQQKDLDEDRKSLLAPIREVVERINEKYKPFINILISADNIVSDKIKAYLRACEVQRLKDQAAAEKRARLERERLQASAEKAEDKGQTEKAQVLMEKASTVVAAPVAELPKSSAGTTRKVWTGKVTNIQAVCKLIADGTIPPTCIEFKQSELNKLASQWKATRQFEGLLFTEDFQLATRSK
jgi:hypothetical protein